MKARPAPVRRHFHAQIGVCTALLTLFAPVAVPAVTARPLTCEHRGNNSVEQLLQCVTVEGVRQHQRALQHIADQHGGLRASGTSGFDASATYVADQLRQAGYDVTVQGFDFPFFQERSPAAFERVSPNPTTFVAGQDFFTVTYSASGDVTATVEAVDLMLPPEADPNTSTSGCEPGDFSGFTAGSIALLQRGTCTFGTKVTNAQAAGAAGIIVFNEGQDGRTDAFTGTLGGPGVRIPVIATSFGIGSGLDGSTVHMVVDTVSETRTTSNVLAELPGRNPDNVVMVGAHLDSVIEGPGINDNGSGSAAILEVACHMAEVKPENTVRFAWWGAEELGLLGSTQYVSDLTANNPGALEDIALYLNFDMVGSPNFVRFVYDGDGSAFGTPGPPGSDAIEALFEDFYAQRGLATEATSFDGRSDYGPFVDAGIPAGGLFTGAEGIKTDEQAATSGGTAGQAYDPCYHQACDTFDNVNLEVLDQNADAIAFATLTYAQTAEPLEQATQRRSSVEDPRHMRRGSTTQGHARRW